LFSDVMVVSFIGGRKNRDIWGESTDLKHW
jgi:hypothetical protein